MTADYGLDVSGYQPVDRVNWLDPRIGFGIVKASEANAWRSKSTALHVTAIRKAQDARLNNPDPAVNVLQMGLYHFFHPDVSAQSQFDNFCAVAALTDYGIGDVVPAVDLESYLTRAATGPHNNPVTPAWSAPAEQLCALLAARYGDCITYISYLGWVEMGRPDWVTQYDQWTAYYALNGHLPPQTCPHVPGNISQPKIFQNYVGPMFGALTGKLQDSASTIGVDQNKKYGDLRLIDAVND
jgi:hypothetical protein